MKKSRLLVFASAMALVALSTLPVDAATDGRSASVSMSRSSSIGMSRSAITNSYRATPSPTSSYTASKPTSIPTYSPPASTFRPAAAPAQNVLYTGEDLRDKGAINEVWHYKRHGDAWLLAGVEAL